MQSDQPTPSPRDRIAECLRVARTAPRPGSLRFERLLERCVASYHWNHPIAVEEIVIDQLRRGSRYRASRPIDDAPGGVEPT